ncbi:unnamed protein product [Mytilus edulis]|uniref:Uncharacterized protein n=1 Tax=Mytilus edulis TaxID=6550 RepID=A0A8S3Q503_MYTED|nr:unnamed protein product [Mytilus edulis]
MSLCDLCDNSELLGFHLHFILPQDLHSSSFIIKCFKPFSAQIDTVGVYSKLYVETSNYHKDLAVQVQNREKKLNTGINPMTQRKIKLQERQLKLTILHAAKMLQDFYPKKIFPRKALFSEEDFWEDEQLKFRDWRVTQHKNVTGSTSQQHNKNIHLHTCLHFLLHSNFTPNTITKEYKDMCC